jgi:hypothetical protein
LENDVVIVAFLQNQWFKDPQRVEKIYARHATLEERASLNARCLFRGCLTGKRLDAAFGKDLCNEIVWEEASPKKSGKSSGAFPADADHIRRIIEHYRPDVVLCFGRVAVQGVLNSLRLIQGVHSIEIRGGPHPAARHATVCDELKEMADWLKKKLTPQTAIGE